MPVTVARRPARTAAGTLGLLLLLAGCTGDPAPDPAPTPATAAPAASAAPSPTSAGSSGSPDAARVRSEGSVVRAGDLTLHVWPPLDDAAVTTGEDGDVALTAPLPAPLPATDGTAAELPAATFAPGEGLTLEALRDDTVVVRDAAGRAVGGLTPPVLSGDAAGSGARVRVLAGDDGTVTWSVVAPAGTSGTAAGGTAAGGTVTGTAAGAALGSATWAERDDEGGRSLAVVPTGWGRAGGLAAEETLWSQLVTAVPEADAQNVHDQLTCHVIGAPDKASWNLEPWRPDVGLLATLGALCNPE